MKDIKKIKILGIDLVKHSFQLHGINHQGVTVFRQKCSKDKLLITTARLAPCTIALEACGSAHY